MMFDYDRTRLIRETIIHVFIQLMFVMNIVKIVFKTSNQIFGDSRKC